MLFALTLWQPWANAIVLGPKRLENRDWRPPPTLIGHVIALHAGKVWDKVGAKIIAAELWSGCPSAPVFDRISAIIGLARIVRVVEDSGDPWFSGPIGWELGDVRSVRPRPCRGHQKLCGVPPDIAESIRAEAPEMFIG